MDQALTIRVRREPGYVIVTVAGELDFATVSGLRARLCALAADGRPLVADLDQVSYIDAAGLGALAGAARQAAVHGTSLHVVCARRQTRRLFRITGLDRVVPLAGTLAEALQVLPAGPPLAGSRFLHGSRAGTLGTPGSELRLFRGRPAPGDAKAMNARFRQSSERQADGATALFDAAAHRGPVPGPADRACCCVARAVVRVVMPPAPGRPHETDLLLCGHHYRVSRHALSAAHARVEELAASSADTTAWFHDDRDRSVRASVAAQ